MNVTYLVEDLTWNAETQMFSAEARDLWAREDFKFPFPNGRKQFYVVNTRTGGCRRFRLLLVLKNDLLFVSEDDILCMIRNVNN